MVSGRSDQTRRDFLKVAAAAGIVAPLVLNKRVFGANERISLGFVGVGNQGGGNLKGFQKLAVDIPAICEVDSARGAAAANLVQKTGGKAEVYTDFRRMFDHKGLDAVVLTVPDHWHALMSIQACQKGLDVYCEKPLSLTIREGRRMVEAARKHNRIVQTGSQQRSSKEFRTACELVRNGAIGKVHTVLAGINKPNHPGPIGPDTDPPAGFDYNMWLGPAPDRPYNQNRVHYNFRFWWDYSGGQMTNFGAHHLDIAQWGLGMDNSGPREVEGTATFHPEKVHEVTESFRITFTYENGTRVIAGQQQKDIPGGATFIGENGKIHVNRGKLQFSDPGIGDKADDPSGVKLIVSDDHMQNFLDCIKTRELPICDVEIGHRSATVCHLGNIVCRLGRPVKWDPEKEAMVNDPEAQAMVERPYRKPWSLT